MICRYDLNTWRSDSIIWIKQNRSCFVQHNYGWTSDDIALALSGQISSVKSSPSDNHLECLPPSWILPLAILFHECLRCIPGEALFFEANDSGEAAYLRQLQNHCAAPEKLELKVRRPCPRKGVIVVVAKRVSLLVILRCSKSTTIVTKKKRITRFSTLYFTIYGDFIIVQYFCLLFHVWYVFHRLDLSLLLALIFT